MGGARALIDTEIDQWAPRVHSRSSRAAFKTVSFVYPVFVKTKKFFLFFLVFNF